MKEDRLDYTKLIFIALMAWMLGNLIAAEIQLAELDRQVQRIKQMEQEFGYEGR